MSVATAERLLTKAEQTPKELTPDEQILLGLSLITTSSTVKKQGLLPKEGLREYTTGGVDLLISGLEGIRLDPNLSEDAKLQTGIWVAGEIDFNNMPSGDQKIRLFTNTLLTIAAGLETVIRNKMDQHLEQWEQSGLCLAAVIRLGSKREELTVGQQLKFLSEEISAKGKIDKKGRTKILVAWARQNIKEGATEDEVATMVQFFFDQENDSAAREITTRYLRQSFEQKANQ